MAACSATQEISVRLQVDSMAVSTPGWLLSDWRRPWSRGAIWSSANAKRPRRSSGAVLWLMPRGQTAMGADYKAPGPRRGLPGSARGALGAGRPAQTLIRVNPMGALNAFNHLLNFVAPAAALALSLALAGRFMRRPRAAVALPWWWQAGVIFIVGVATLLAGLMLWGRDGKMLTYAALVLACASCQWLLLRGWKA